MTPYQLLELDQNNYTIDDLKKAYRKACLKYHPDVNKDSNASVIFREVNSAYEFLKDNYGKVTVKVPEYKAPDIKKEKPEYVNKTGWKIYDKHPPPPFPKDPGNPLDRMFTDEDKFNQEKIKATKETTKYFDRKGYFCRQIKFNKTTNSRYLKIPGPLIPRDTEVLCIDIENNKEFSVFLKAGSVLPIRVNNNFIIEPELPFNRR
jgi:curved DNA-binding protein CbpA